MVFILRLVVKIVNAGEVTFREQFCLRREPVPHFMSLR